MSGRVAPWPPAPGTWDLLVNCTPVGMHPHLDESPVPAAALTRRYVYDLVYNPPATRLLRDAAAAGCETIGGLDMLVAQAQEQFSLVDRNAARPPASCAPPRSGVSRSSSPMKITSFEEFKELARRGTFVPVCKEIVADLLTPVSAFLKIAEDADYAFLLESVEGGEHVGRYSFLGKDPFLILRARDGRTTLERGGAVTESERPFIETLRGLDGRLPVAVRARPAAIHGRRRRLPRLRRGVVVRAGARRPRRRARTAPTRPASCCSTRCSRSITSSTAS